MARRIPTKSCTTDLATTIQQFAPLFLFFGEVFILRTCIIQVFIVTQIFLLGNVFIHWQQIKKLQDITCSLTWKETFLQWLIGEPAFFPLWIGIYFHILYEIRLFLVNENLQKQQQ